MMGAGKTTIGKAISKQLSIQFIDIDKVIENKLGLTIQEIFEKKGEAFFRKFEEKITLQEVKKKILNFFLYPLVILLVLFLLSKFNFPAPKKEIKKNITNEIIKLK